MKRKKSKNKKFNYPKDAHGLDTSSENSEKKKRLKKNQTNKQNIKKEIGTNI